MGEIVNHPVIGDLSQAETVLIYFEGDELLVRKGQTVAAALMANEIYRFGSSRKLNQPRGLYCGNGRCHSCLMTIDGVEHVRSCSTLVRDGMVITKSDCDPDVRRDYK